MGKSNFDKTKIKYSLMDLLPRNWPVNKILTPQLFSQAALA
jgi:hypothetical protein